VLAAAGCRRGPGSPRECWQLYRRAVETRDAANLRELLDQDEQEERRQGMRLLRGLLARGDPPTEVLAGTPFTVEDVTPGTLDEGVGRAMAKGSPFVRDASWFLATEVAEEVADGADAAKLVLRNPDGRTFDCWFVREPRGWVIDYSRTWPAR
jgi:hypothetical protein